MRRSGLFQIQFLLVWMFVTCRFLKNKEGIDEIETAEIFGRFCGGCVPIVETLYQAAIAGPARAFPR